MTVSLKSYGLDTNWPIRRLRFVWTSDASGDVAATSLVTGVYGFIVGFAFSNGANPHATSTSVTIKDDLGRDMLAGLAAAITPSAGANALELEKGPTDMDDKPFVTDAVTFEVASTDVAAKDGIIDLFVLAR